MPKDKIRHKTAKATLINIICILFFVQGRSTCNHTNMFWGAALIVIQAKFVAAQMAVSLQVQISFGGLGYLLGAASAASVNLIKEWINSKG